MKNLAKLIVLAIALQSCGVYNNWSREQDRLDAENKGKSLLLESESSKKVLIETAKANLEAARLNAQADSVRAMGIASANRIIGLSLRDNPGYLEWLWIDNIEKNQNAVYYIPTENKFPIMQTAPEKKPAPEKQPAK